ncbi:MAG: GTA-gp10 family protein [Pseudomonadota bacterium]
MRGDVKVKIGRKSHTLRLTLGSVEDIPADSTSSPAVPFMPASVLNALAQNLYSMHDVRVIIEAGIAGSSADLSYDDVFEAKALKDTAKIALDLLMSFYGIDPSGKAVAAPETVETEASTS